MEFDIGTAVECSDGHAGRVIALIADPISRMLTDIAVEPEHHPERARLVSVGLLVVAADGERVDLRCAREDLASLPRFHDVEFAPYIPDFGDPGATLAWPYLGLPDREIPLIVDRVPVGEIEIRRHDSVHATDGSLGRVEGLVVDSDRNITHILLQEGHLWGKKEVAIPIGALDRLDTDGIHLRMTKRELTSTPEIELYQRPPEA